jgi:hypothetical protein
MSGGGAGRATKHRSSPSTIRLWTVSLTTQSITSIRAAYKWTIRAVQPTDRDALGLATAEEAQQYKFAEQGAKT